MSEAENKIENLPTLNTAISEVLQKSAKPLLMHEVYSKLRQQGYQVTKLTVSQMLSRSKGNLFYKYPNGLWTLKRLHNQFTESQLVKRPKKGTITAYVYDLVKEHQPADFNSIKEILLRPEHLETLSRLTADPDRYIRYHVIAYLNTLKQYFKRTSDGKWTTTDV